MKKQFEDLYYDLETINENDLNHNLKAIKEENKNRNTIFIILAIIIDILIFILSNNSFMGIQTFNIFNFIMLCIVVDICIYVSMNILFSKSKRKYKEDFKKYIIKELINNFYDAVNYFPHGKMPRDIYNEAKYSEYYNKYNSDDYIEGKINNKYDMKMAEVRTEYERTEQDEDGNTSTSTNTVFNGLFAKINIDKSINSELTITNKSIVRMINKNRIEMDSQEFEKYFDVVSNNNIIAMQLLTHDIMDMLVEFRRTTKINYDIVIFNNNMYLRFFTGPMFEMKSIKSKAMDREILKKYYDILNFTYTLSENILKAIEEAEI